MWALVPALLFIALAAAIPSALGYPYRVWMLISHVVGWINTRVVLSLVFYFVFTPVALVMRLIGRDTMQRKFEPDAATYRIPKSGRGSSHIKHQF